MPLAIAIPFRGKPSISCFLKGKGSGYIASLDMEPTIAVVFLSCNRTAFIREALESIRQQAFTGWSVVASDCSNNPVARKEITEILQEFREKVPEHKVQILLQPKIMPEGENLRAALAAVTEPYVALLHDDDVWMPNHLERSVAWLDQSPKHGLTISNGRVIDANSAVLGWTNSRETPLPQPSDQKGWLRLLMTSFFGAASGYVFRKEALAGHLFYPIAVVDIDVAVSILLNDYEVIGLPEASYFYRVHAGSNYQKGLQVIRDRHIWRLWLFRRQGLRIMLKFPLFIFLVAKSAAERIHDVFQTAIEQKPKPAS